MIPTARHRHLLRAIAAALVVGGALVVAREAHAIARGAIAHFPSDDAKAALAAAFFGATIASIDLRWTLQARRAGERATLPLFVDAATTLAIVPVIAAFVWGATW